jgi:hypothetical protein
MTILLPSIEEEKELWRLYRLYWKEASKCEKSEAYLAGCAMLGSALETLLILMISVHSEEIEKIGAYPRIKGRLPKPVLKWNLSELLNASKLANWLPTKLQLTEECNSKRAQIGDYAEVVRVVRNLIHPARYLQDHNKSRVTRKYLQQQFEIFLACRDWLLKHNNEVLLAHIKTEESKTN